MFVNAFFSLAMASETYGGAGLSMISLRSSMGTHRSHIGGGVWIEKQEFKTIFSENAIVAYRYSLQIAENKQQIPNDLMWNTVVQPSVLCGLRFGILPTKVGFFTGIASQLLVGGANQLVITGDVGIMGMIDILRPIRNELSLNLEISQTWAGTHSNYGLVVGGQKKW